MNINLNKFVKEMKHLKLFENESAFEAAKDNLAEPWVALVSDNVAYGSEYKSQPNNEIWYTSENSNIIVPTTPSSFGVTLIDNSYEKGKGVMKFDGDVTSIGNSAFHGCSSLTSVEIPNSVTKIDVQAFYKCSSFTSVEIPNSVTRIGDSAFQSCSGLTSVTIPNSVTSIGTYAFYGCSSLTSVTYNGTIEQWNAITKGSNWKNSVPTTCQVHCTDGDIAI